MRRLFLAAITAAMPFGVHAAEMAIKAPAPVVADRWAGLYAGVNVGYGFASDVARFVPLDPGGAARLGFIDQALRVDSDGVVGGVQLGINAQHGNNVLGFEVDFQKARIDGSASGPPHTVVLPAVIVTSAEDSLSWFGTARGRLGYTTGSSLFYATGGLAFGRVSFSPSFTELNGGSCASRADFCFVSEVDRWKAGWTLGAGWEYAFAARWSAKLEYLHYDLGSVTTVMTPVNGLPGVTYAGSTEFKGDIVRAGVNFRFSGP